MGQKPLDGQVVAVYPNSRTAAGYNAAVAGGRGKGKAKETCETGSEVDVGPKEKARRARKGNPRAKAIAEAAVLRVLAGSV